MIAEIVKTVNPKESKVLNINEIKNFKDSAFPSENQSLPEMLNYRVQEYTTSATKGQPYRSDAFDRLRLDLFSAYVCNVFSFEF